MKSSFCLYSYQKIKPTYLQGGDQVLSVLLSWIYISAVCTLIGMGILRLFKNRPLSLNLCHITGFIVITVYTEFVSIFIKIGSCAHLILLSIALLSGYINRNEIKRLWKYYCPVICSWEGFFYACFVLLTSFFASRGEFHTDTNIYHAAAIRIYEEYGLVKGIGNLQLHYAYNSSYLAFAAIFSLKWLLGRSLHTTTGFLETMMCLYAFRGLRNFKQHENHITDMMRIGILLYTLLNITRSMSPATDYASMYFSLYIITAWCENLFEKQSSVNIYSFLAVAAVFSATLKFSSCLLILLAIYPACTLIREKHWRRFVFWIFCGCVVLCPFLIRNYFISGWLLYPFDGIDIFQTVWKVPAKYLQTDANQIKVWGRCLYDVEKIDLPIRQWLPVWWEHQVGYEKMFLIAVVLGTLLQLVIFFDKILKRQKLQPQLLILHLTIWGNIAVWFFMSPFIRYGLAFLIAVIMIAIGEYLSRERRKLYSIVTGSLTFCILVLVTHYSDEYIIDIGVFTKCSLSEPYYIVQKDYDKGSMDNCEINGNPVYFSTEGEVNSYHVFPGTCYKFMLERSTLIGNRIEDGFCAK